MNLISTLAKILHFGLITFCFCLPLDGFSLVTQHLQASKLDSLQTIITTSLSDSIKIEALLAQASLLTYQDAETASGKVEVARRLAENLGDPNLLLQVWHSAGQLSYNSSSYDLCIKNYSKALALAKQIEENSAVSQALIWLGNAHGRKGSYDSAKIYHFQNIEFCKTIGDQEGVASSYNNMANLHNDQGDFTKAAEYYSFSLKEYEKLGQEFSVGIVLANMGMIHNRLENYDLAIEYLKQADVIFRRQNHQGGITFVLKNLGTSYKNKGDLDNAMRTYRLALKTYLAMNSRFELGGVYHNIGNIYFEKRKVDSARWYYERSLDYALEIEDSLGMARTHNAIGASYLVLNDFDNAMPHLLISKKIGEATNNSFVVMNAEEHLFVAYKGVADYEHAYKSLYNFKTIKDSLHSVEKIRDAKEIESKYQNEKKQKEIELLSSQNSLSALQLRKRENERNFLFALALAIFIIGFVTFRQYKIKKSSNKKLTALNHLQSSFFANISHEFRTPLTLILANLDKIEDQQSDVVAVMSRNARRLLQLINQLLDLSKLEAGSEKLQVQKLQISPFIKVLAHSFVSLAEDKHINYVIHVHNTSLEGYVDTDKVEKIVYNLLSNAFKFTPSGGQVEFRCVADEGNLTIDIKDTGIGIPEDAINRIFNRFYQINTNDNRAYEGSGIGLSLIKELVELHQGTINVQSEIHKGSKFTVIIPLAGYSTSQISLEKVKPSQQLTLLPKQQEAKRKEPSLESEDEFVVLIVEDNPDLLNHLAEMTQTQYKTLTAVNGEEGLKQAQQHIPDLIITDLMMPKMDGKEMCQQIKSNEKTSHIPVLMLTAKADRESKMKGLEMGADDYLTKPFDALELRLKIKNILQQREHIQTFITNRFFFPNPQLSAQDQFIKKVSDLIQANISNSELSVDQFNNELGYSRMQLHRKIKAITGLSTSEFIRSIRLKKAALLLEKEFDQVAQIAYETGFSSPSYFTKCFREVYGISPKAYAANHQQTLA